MRLLYSLLLILIIPACLYAQQNRPSNQLPAQLKKVLAEASNSFDGFKGEQVKDQQGEITYASTITLQGTTENQIMDFDAGGSYIAKLGETTNPKEAQTLVETWKRKVLANLAGSRYEMSKDNQRSDESEQKGYLLSSDKVSISIYSIQYTGEKSISAFLLIMRL